MKSLTLKEIKGMLRANEMAPLKSLGQNFLLDANALKMIADAPELGESDVVLEIGPGMGALTCELLSRAGKVVAVEVDRGMVRVLGELVEEGDNIEVIHADILDIEFEKLHKELGGGRFSVCANLPYYITTPIIMQFLQSDLPIDCMVFLMQKEVAQRLSAKPGSKSYGALTVAIEYYTDVEVVGTVAPECFYPAPEVTSCVVKLMPKAEKVLLNDEKLFFRVVHCAFAMRRKMLSNNLVKEFALDRQAAIDVICAAGLAETVRGETLNLQQFVHLADTLHKMVINN